MKGRCRCCGGIHSLYKSVFLMFCTVGFFGCSLHTSPLYPLFLSFQLPLASEEEKYIVVVYLHKAEHAHIQYSSVIRERLYSLEVKEGVGKILAGIPGYKLRRCGGEMLCCPSVNNLKIHLNNTCDPWFFLIASITMIVVGSIRHNQCET